MKKNTSFILGIILGFLFTINVIFALPSGPGSVTVVQSSRYSTSGAANITAMAGNTTELVLNGTSITQTWQGYYGNVTGTIVLGNSNNQTLYNWNLTSPSGQIYATRTTSIPTWASIRCVNQTEVYDEEIALGTNASVDGDAVNKTFTNMTFTQFYVGSVNINSSQNCKSAQLFDSSGPSASFAEVLLTDTTNLIYTGLITTPTSGFDSKTHQFEMLVGQNGHSGGTTTTPYYFYLELH